MFYNIEDSYVIDEGSGGEESESSDEEQGFEFMLKALLGQKNGYKRKMVSAEDDFEREMNAELDATLNKIQNDGKPSNIPAIESSGENTAQKFYEDVYFDSDAEDDDMKSSKRRQKRKHPVISDEDLFYDPNMDQEDQDWVDKRRQSHRPKNQSKAKRSNTRSDAVLNCPACMTTLCDDCQRHDIYRKQFRAMFVFNCTVDLDKVLQHKPKVQSRKGKNQPPQPEPLGLSDLYHPVRCSQCKTEVAVYDKDEVYHFFNVLVSHC